MVSSSEVASAATYLTVERCEVKLNGMTTSNDRAYRELQRRNLAGR